MNGAVESVLLCKAKAIVVGLAASAASADVGPSARILLTAVFLKGETNLLGVESRVLVSKVFDGFLLNVGELLWFAAATAFALCALFAFSFFFSPLP